MQLKLRQREVVTLLAALIHDQSTCPEYRNQLISKLEQALADNEIRWYQLKLHAIKRGFIIEDFQRCDNWRERVRKQDD